MKKLQHQNSSAVRTLQTTHYSEESSDIPSNLSSTVVKSLEGKLFMLEERNKTILTFYQQKMQQLRLVLQKQQDTKEDLTQELANLSMQNQQQNQYVDELKRGVPNGGCVKGGEGKLDRMSNRGNGSKGKQLLLRKKLGCGVPILKKCRSSQFIECQYLVRQQSKYNIQQ